MPNSKVFTIILDTYYRPALLQAAVDAIRRQTYEKLEIILVNNGGTPETVECLQDYEARDRRVKLVHFKKNQFSLDDPTMMLDTCLNAGLEAATGDYVWYQSDDDLIADDYAEKMVDLFEGNPECTTAAGLPVIIDIDGYVIDTKPRVKNIRPRYMPGNLLALDQLQGGNMLGTPGTIFTIRRDVLVKSGGFNRALESSHLYGIVPFGITGFDETAAFYWRNHSGQLNKQLTASGWTDFDNTLGLLKDWRIEDRWSVFGADVARSVVRSYKKRAYDDAARWFVIHVYAFRPKPAIRIMRKVWSRPYFWRQVFAHAIERKYYLQAIAPVLKPPLKRVFRALPSLARLTPALGRLSDKAERWN